MITISLCLIVKNEELTLERCLTSVAGIPDEIIIVDTGSTDTTKAIAAKWTPHVYDYAWSDDFSAARNASFQYATQEYILWLDADDILEPDERNKLMQLKHTLTEEADAVTMNYAMLQDDGLAVITQALRVRLVKRASGFEWRGVVHEDLALDSHFRLMKSGITVTHKRVPREGHEPSSTRNLRIYEQQLARGHTFNTSEMYHYASECQIHQRYDQAILYYEQCLTSSEVPLETQLGIMHKLAACYALSGQPEKEMELTLKSFTMDAPYPAFCCRMGEYFLMKGMFEAAIDWYHTACSSKLGEKHAWFYVENAFHTWLPHHHLGLCYEALGNKELAQYHREQAAAYRNPNPA